LLEQEVDPEEAAKWQCGTAETMAKLVFPLGPVRVERRVRQGRQCISLEPSE
jgi:hypothetical protein